MLFCGKGHPSLAPEISTRCSWCGVGVERYRKRLLGAQLVCARLTAHDATERSDVWTPISESILPKRSLPPPC